MFKPIQLLLLFSLVKVNFSELTITVFTETGFEGRGTSLNISDCLPTLPSNLDGQIQGTHTQDNCVQFYKEQFCRGEYLIVRSGSHHHDNLWEYGFGNNIRSVSKCFESCHPELIHSPPDAAAATPTNVEFYDGSTRPRNVFTVKPSFCLDISSEMSEWSWRRHITIKLHPSPCIELHQFGNCSGSLIHLYVGNSSFTTPTPTHSGGGGQLVTFFPEMDKAKSLSFCGYNCHTTQSSISVVEETLEGARLDEPQPPPDNNGTIPLLPHKDFANAGEVVGDGGGLGMDILLWLLVALCLIIVFVGVGGIIYWRRRHSGKGGDQFGFRYNRTDNLNGSAENL